LERTIEEVAQKLLEEKDADMRTRIYHGSFAKIFSALLVFWACFQIYTNIWRITEMSLRMWNCMFLVIFTILIYPALKK
jgi:TRAP-type uncharacterized transport system fused permease subunit